MCRRTFRFARADDGRDNRFAVPIVVALGFPLHSNSTDVNLVIHATGQEIKSMGETVTFAELQHALQVLNLREQATLKEIKARHRELVKRYHPDTGNEHDQETIRTINAAHSVLLMYVAGYRFSFGEDEFYAQNPEEHLRRQFMDDPLWGKK